MIKGMIKYHLLLLIREPYNLLLGFGLPFLTLLIAAPNASEHYGAVEMLFIVNTLIGILILTFTDTALNHVSAREMLFMKRMRMTPLTPFVYLLSSIISKLIVLLLFVAVFALFSHLIAGMSFAGINWLGFGVVVTSVFLMFYFVAMFFANVLKDTKIARSTIMIVFFALLLLGNLFLQVDNLPEIIVTLSNYTPTVFAMNLKQNVWFGTSIFYGFDFVIVVGITAVLSLLTTNFFRFE